MKTRSSQPGYRFHSNPTDPLERDPEAELPPRDQRHLSVGERQRRQAADWSRRQEANEYLRDFTR